MTDSSIERYQAPPTDMRVPATDSWTDVLGDIAQLATRIAPTEFVPQGLRTPEKTAAAILTARELGLPPMQGLAAIHVINGRPGISAEMMRALILSAGHDLVVSQATEVKCVLRGRRAGGEGWTEVAYTMAEAQRAGDIKKNPSYTARPMEMLLARATTRLARMAFPDVIHGLASVEELEVDGGDTPPSPGTVAPVAPSTTETVTRRRGTRGKVVPAEPAPEQTKRPPAAPSTTAAPDDAVIDAVVVGEAPEPPGDTPSSTPDVPMSGSQRATIMQHFQRIGLRPDERDARLHWMAVMLGLDSIDTTSDLTRRQATEVIARLGQWRDVAAMEEALTSDLHDAPVQDMTEGEATTDE